MANDLPDWSTQVNVTGSVTVLGTATVTISGTPTVNLSGGTTVNIGNTPAVTISGTPAVTISGTPTVILGGGSASIGSVSAINSTVTVAGTINIGNTPAVTVSGTVTVSVANTPAVTISGTPTVTISSGSVSITGTASISIVAQTITVSVALPWASVGTKTAAGAGAENFTTSTVAAGTLTLGILIEGGATHSLTALQVAGVQSGTLYLPQGGGVVTGWVAVPVNAARDTTYLVSWASSVPGGGVISAYASALAIPVVSVGQNSKATSAAVAIASDQLAIPVYLVTPNPGSNQNAYNIRTFRAAASFLNVINATDVFVLTGAAGIVIKLKRVRFVFNAAAATVAFALIGRSTADTVGTFVADTKVSMDNQLAASGAGNVGHYTANPTLGTLVGPITTTRYTSFPNASAVAQSPIVEWTFGDIPGSSPYVLRGAAQQIALNGGGTLAAGSMSVEFEWTEEV